MSARFDLTGVNGSVQFSKGGTRIVDDGAGKLQVRDNGDSADANMSGLDAVAAQDFVTLTQLQAAQAGLYWKQPVRAATVVAGTLASDFANGDTIDGVVLATGDRILIKTQVDAIENGIYIVEAAGAPTRAPDLLAGSDAASIAMFVEEGTANADSAFTCTNDQGSADVGVDGLIFVIFANITGAVTGSSSLGGGVAVTAGTTAPTLTFNSIENGSVITASLSSNLITLGIATGSVTEAMLATNVGVLYRSVLLPFGGWPATTGVNLVNLGAVVPVTAIVLSTRAIVDTAFDNGALANVGETGTPDILMDETEIDLEVADTYVVDRSQVTPAAQLTVQRVTGVAQPTVGNVRFVVEFLNVA